MDGKITYHQQVSYCGKPRCRRCREGIGHGPYWYAYQTVNGRTVRTYIGKEAPPEVLAAAQAETSVISSPEFANTLLRLYVLGQFRLEQRVNGQNGSSPHWEQVTEASLQHQRVRSLLSCLVSSPGRKLGREQVMYALWQELDLDVASHRLDRAVHSLRQVFEPGRSRPASSKLLLTEHATLTLADQSQFWIDADAFENLISQGRALQESDPGRAERLMEEAMDLYGGDFIPGEDSIEWVTSRREALRRSWISLLLELADLRLAREALPAALDVLDRLLGADPTNEAAVQRMIVLQAQMGRRGESIQVYQNFAELIRQRYAIEPLPETRALYDKVRAGVTPELVSRAITPGTGAGAPFAGNAISDGATGSAPLARAALSPGAADTSGFTPGGMPAVGPAHMHIGRTQQSPLVGRDQEMRRLLELLNITEGTRRQRLAGEKRSSLLAPLDLNAQRRPQCVILMGDVGIGKTRLAEEAAREAKRHNWAVAWCRAYTQESSVPYRLWTETLRKAMTQGLWQRNEVTRRPLIYQPLRSLLPELQDLLPHSLQMVPPPPEQEQLRLWESTRALLSTICEGTTLLIVLDDVQWADSSSCEMLIYLVRQMRGQPVMFLCTCRDTELPAGHHLRPLLTDLQREQAVEIVPVTPLSDREIRALLAHLPEPMVESISERASGNPFFAEELARSIAGASDSASLEVLPDTIQAVLDLRLARITDRCRHILERGAVLGVSFQFDAIRDMASVNEDEILDILEEGLQAGMLTEEGSGMRITYHFWHPLLQAYLYDHLSHARRANLHRRAAQALQNLHAGDESAQAAEIADHLVKGGAAPSLIARYAELAADHAYSLSAYAGAEKYYRLVLQHTPELTLTAPQDDRLHRAYVLERLGECTMIVGKFEDVRTFYEQALEIRNINRLFASDEERKYEAQIDALIWCEVSRAWRYLGNSEKARESVNRGEQVLVDAEVPAGPAWARVRYQQGHTLWLEGNLTEALAMANEALQRFDTAPARLQESKAPLLLTQAQRILNGDSVGLGRVYTLLAGIEATLGQSTQALNHLNKSLAVFEQNDVKNEVANVCCNLADIYLRSAEYTSARTVLTRSYALAEDIGLAPIKSVALGNLGVLATRLGNLVEAETWHRKALDLIVQMNELFYISLFHSYLAAALIEQGKLDEAEPLLTQALKISHAQHIPPCTGFALVVLGQLRLIRALANNVQIYALSSTQKGLSKKFQSLLGRARITLRRALAFDGLEADTVLNGRLFLAKIALLLGELENAHDLATKALEEARSSELVWLQARAEYLIGQTLIITGQKEAAETLFRRALTTFAGTGMRLEYARALQAYAEALLQTSENSATRKQALHYLQEARQTFQECGAALDQQMVERLLASMQGSQSEEATPGARIGAAFTESGAGGHGQERRGH